MSETSKNRETVRRYLGGNGIDIGSGGDPVVPECVSFDLPISEYQKYGQNGGQVNLRGDARSLPFKNATLDFVYSSHLLEDFSFEEWSVILAEWVRVLKPKGSFVILIPDRKAWAAAVAAGQPPNVAHKHEGSVGELSSLAPKLGLAVLRDERIGDYSILFVATKL